LVLFVHPAGSAICSPFIIDYNYGGSVGTSLEDATFVLHMIAKQIPYRYPNIKFIVPHLGGPIPMLLNRLDKQGQNPGGHPNLPEAHLALGFYYYYCERDYQAALDNAKAALVTRGLVEIIRLGKAMGAKDATFDGLAGLGDLITTCVSPERPSTSRSSRWTERRNFPDPCSYTRSLRSNCR
jgi:hypothetical protein